MTDIDVEPADPASITSRADFGRALTALRTRAGLSIRDVVDASGALHGTVAGWFSGQHLPTRASEPAFHSVLQACGVTDENDRQQWIDAARRARQARARRRTTDPVPYRGLAPFQEEDAEWFYGRDRLTDEVLGRIRAAIAGEGPRVLFVIGPSGSGKSSLLRAGVAATVGSRPEFADWKAVVLTPSSAGPDKAVAALNVDAPTVLIVDQFEEFWTLGDDEGRADFVDRLGELSAGVVVVLGLRADFYPLAAREPRLVPILEAGPVVVGPMSPEELESVIVQPAVKAGSTVPTELVQVLLADLTPRTSRSKGEAGMLPLLSHALLGLWQRADRRTLTVADYTAIGGISGAVQQTAEEVYSTLGPGRQALARRVFLRLVNVEDDTQTRRRVPRSELAFTDGDGVDEIVDRFADARLLTVDEDSVQLSHEVLLTAWDRLRGWIDSDRVGLTVHRDLTRAAQVWEDSGRDESALLGGGRLVLFEDWSRTDDNGEALNRLEREFLAESVAHRDAAVAAERRRTAVLRRLVGSLTVASVVALVLAIVATVAGVHAHSRSIEAQQARDEAMSRQIATVSSQLRAVEPSVSAQLAIAGYQVADTPEARSALLDATGVHVPLRLAGPPGPILARATADGGLVVSAASDGQVRIWTADSRGPETEPLTTFTAGDGVGELYALAVSPDGNSVAVGGQGGIWLWDITDSATPDRVAVLSGEENTAYALEFSPDGTRLVAGVGDGSILRWNVTDSGAAALPPIPGAAEGAVFPVFSPDGRLLVAGGRQMSLRVWETERWDTEMVPRFETAPDGSTQHVLAVAFSPDGHTFAAGTTGRRVMRLDLTDPAAPVPLPDLDGFTSYVNSVAFDPDGRRIAAASSDNTVWLWADATDPEPAAPIATLPGSNPVTSVVFVGDRALLTTALDGAVRWWPLPGPVLPADETIYVNPIGPDGDLVLFGQGRSGELPLWDIGDATEARELPPLDPPVETRFSGAATLAPDGRLAAGGTSTGAVHLWDVEDPEAPAFTGTVEEAVPGVVGAVSFDPSAPVLAVAPTEAKTVALVDVSDPAAPRVVSTFETNDLPYMISWHPTAHVLAVAATDGNIELWDTSDSAAARRISVVPGFDSQTQAVAFGRGGTLLAAASADRTIRLWDVTDIAAPQDLSRITGPADAVYSVQFSPDGERLAGGIGDGTAWIWDVSRPDEPKLLATLTAYGSRVYDATFADDGEVLVAGGPDLSVRLWQLDPALAVTRLCDSVGSPVTEDEWERYLPGVPYRQPCAEED
ncbi:helix-turn-helix domain-containing protein [Rhodococcus sp. Z13]|uniref:Helix-turn-helix domain-containing protein n=1 Tax=Rhodococcus sacchari TaxID=2962047 RepID=A0ACD4DGX1_9NOCA|nr:helix-turn-helix domain-containing protein [Rhodococcus sp. Z13]UYP18943.1 helix-turn-helix domain-containing protein [Rhodococcus sp. Z13]